MAQDIYDPLKEYVNVFQERFRKVAEDTFAELAAEANINKDANQKTCSELYKAEEELKSVKTDMDTWKTWNVLLWVGAAAGTIATFAYMEELSIPQLILAGTAIVLTVVFQLKKVEPNLELLKTEGGGLAGKVDKLKKKAWEQMAPLNRLYDWDILTRMITQTVPKLEFDPYFTTQRLADLKKTYHWSDSFNTRRSVIYAHSGLIHGNPFIICRTRRMVMESKTYYGSKTITWTTYEKGSDDEYHLVSHEQVLKASVTAPYPRYEEKTRLIYGNTAAPDLTFRRKKSGLAGKEKSLSYKLERQALREKARNLEKADFAMLTNEDFEVAFNTSNRNHNQQFALLFTPVAQESMLNLLTDTEVGYGDDFDFIKDKMINIIISDHLQKLKLDMKPDRYHHFDYEKAKEDFYTENAQYFKAVYFSMAPLLCVPMYQQIRPPHDIYGRKKKHHSCFWEHEALANFWGQYHFKHPDCVTDCILKTEHIKNEDNTATIIVKAHGYCAESRLTYVTQMGDDGYEHDVPVYWNEYIPVTGCGSIDMKEDNTCPESFTSQSQRVNHINQVLNENGLDVYRRHIASRI